MLFYYHLFQFKLLSELYLPELIPAIFSTQEADIVIKLGSIRKEGLKNPITQTSTFHAKHQILWMHIPNVAHYVVSSGQEIIIDPYLNADESSIRLFLLGSCMAALLMQRNFLILHANAICIGENAISIAGDSGMGKSTLSASFAQRGYRILTDDICVINQAGEVMPCFPQIKLWSHAANQLKINIKTLRKIRPEIEKYVLPLEKQFSDQSLPLKLVYILNSHSQQSISLQNIHGFEKYPTLFSQIYRRCFVRGLQQEQSYQIQCINLAKTIEICRLNRPQKGDSLQELTHFIESDLIQRGLLRTN